MIEITITDPNDRSFPFGRDAFDDPQTVFHGTWSTWSGAIEASGFARGVVPFDWKDVATVYQAHRAVGRGSYLELFLGDTYPQVPPARDVYLSANFWFARAYATDAGGEVVRNAIQEAELFEDLCTTPGKLKALEDHWMSGLRRQPDHSPTLGVLAMIRDGERMRRLLSEVTSAKDRLRSLTRGGHPVVYVLRADPSWIAADWERFLGDWRIGRREVNIRCRADAIPTDRILGKVSYPAGTEPDFTPTLFTTWDEVCEFLGRC